MYFDEKFLVCLQANQQNPLAVTEQNILLYHISHGIHNKNYKARYEFSIDANIVKQEVVRTDFNTRREKAKSFQLGVSEIL